SSYRYQHHRKGQEDYGIPENLHPRVILCLHYWKHWNTGPLVVLLDKEGKRPEVGWSPEENDREQPPGRNIHPSGGGGPSNHWRYCSCCATNNDIVRCGALQPQGIHEDVEQQPA